MILEDVIGFLDGRIKITRNGKLVLDFEWDEYGSPVFNVGWYDILDQLTVYGRFYVDKIIAERKNVFVVEIVSEDD